MKTLISYLLISSLLFNGCMAGAGSTASPNSQPQEGDYTGVFIGAAVVGLVISIAVAVSKSQRHQAAEAKFHACIGKTKAEIYALYGPPDSIVDDGRGDGGTILEYKHITSTTNFDGSISTTTNRKMFYLNQFDRVTSVSEDSR